MPPKRNKTASGIIQPIANPAANDTADEVDTSNSNQPAAEEQTIGQAEKEEDHETSASIPVNDDNGKTNEEEGGSASDNDSKRGTPSRSRSLSPTERTYYYPSVKSDQAMILSKDDLENIKDIKGFSMPRYLKEFLSQRKLDVRVTAAEHLKFYRELGNSVNTFVSEAHHHIREKRDGPSRVVSVN